MASSNQIDHDDTAPVYTIPSRRLGALEHPMIIKNLDKGIKTFGQHNAFQAVSLPRLLHEENGPADM
jgi:general transcription factor 3C polypeptide 5 (transcription factor C subunit 1)